MNVSEGDRIIYDDGRTGHQGVSAVILAVDVMGMLVQFDDRADTTRIQFSDHGWMDFIRLKRDNWNDPPFSALDRDGNIRVKRCAECGAEEGSEQWKTTCLNSPQNRPAKDKAKREKRNAAQRARYQARKDLGLVRTPYGWE